MGVKFCVKFWLKAIAIIMALWFMTDGISTIVFANRNDMGLWEAAKAYQAFIKFAETY